MQMCLEMGSYGRMSSQGVHLVEEHMGIFLQALLLDLERFVYMVYDPLCTAAYLHHSRFDEASHVVIPLATHLCTILCDTYWNGH
jgi:hypothetical protein